MSSSDKRPPPTRKLRGSAFWFAVFAIGALVAIGIWIARGRLADPTPPLTEQSFAAAWERWRERGPRDYEIQIRVTGTQPATYRVHVVDGEAQEAFRNGQPLLQKRTFETWSVPGMFSTIEADLTRLTRPHPNSAPPRMTLRAEFDAELGYPRKYRRIEWGQATEVSWVVESLELTK